MPSGPVFCLADEGETYAVDESVATCSLEQTNDAAYWISQATFISKDSHMSIDCAHVCETDWMYIRYDDPKKQAMFNGIFSCMNSSNLKRPRWWARWCFRPSRDKNNSALGANAKQTLDSFISSLTLLYFIDLYCASYFYVQYSSHMYDFSFFFFSAVLRFMCSLSCLFISAQRFRVCLSAVLVILGMACVARVCSEPQISQKLDLILWHDQKFVCVSSFRNVSFLNMCET